MITYSEFIRLRRAEDEGRGELTAFNDKMLDEMKEYIAINKQALEECKKSNDDARALEISTKIKNALEELNKTINRRINKLTQIAIEGRGLDPKTRQNMLSQEIVLFDNLVDIINSHKSKVIREIKDAEPKVVQQSYSEEDGSEKAVIKIMTDVPKFIWKNNRSYGPFSFPNVIEIDKDVAEILVKSGKAAFV